MAFAAAIPLIASLIPAIGSLFGGGGNKEGEGQGAQRGGDMGATHAALGSMLASQEGKGGDHPVLKGTDLPPVLATVLNSKRSGHVVPHAQTAAGRLGHRGVLHPNLEKAIHDIHASQQQAPIKRHQEKAARAQVRRVEQAVVPQLRQLQSHLRERATQVQATAEHNAIVQRDARWQALADQQRQVLQKLDAIDRRLTGNWRRY